MFDEVFPLQLLFRKLEKINSWVYICLLLLSLGL